MAHSEGSENPKYRHVLGCGPSEWSNMLDLHKKNFDDDPVLRYLFGTKPEPERIAILHRFIGVMQGMAKCQNGIFDQVWTTDTEKPELVSGITWLRPGCSQDNPKYYFQTGMIGVTLAAGLRSIVRILYDWQYQDLKAKRAGLRRADGSRIKQYYYMAWVSTVIEARGQGLSPQLIRKFQEKAAKEKLPIWTEASSPGSHRVYKRCGFKDVRMIYVGKGSVDEKGFKQKGGSGVPVATLVWMPPEI